jgi:tRNA(adenine34) deaminase
VGIEFDDNYWMELALKQAQLAAEQGEVPVGAVLVDEDNQLLASGHNQPISSHDPTAHAEIVTLRRAAEKLNNYRLINSTLYVTLEPCVMCVGAMIHARVKRLVYGAVEYKTGAIESACQLLETTRFNHRIEVSSGVLQEQCAAILSDFFAQRRAAKQAIRGNGKNP